MFGAGCVVALQVLQTIQLAMVRRHVGRVEASLLPPAPPRAIGQRRPGTLPRVRAALTRARAASIGHAATLPAPPENDDEWRNAPPTCKSCGLPCSAAELDDRGVCLDCSDTQS